MTRQHFRMLAEMVKDLRLDYGDEIPANALIGQLASTLRTTNGQFDTGRFVAACEPPKPRRAMTT